MEIKPITKTYKEIGSNGFQQLMMKLANTPTTNYNAAKIHWVTKAFKKAQEQITSEFKAEFIEKFGQKGEDGKLLNNEFNIMEGKEIEYQEAIKVFEAKTYDFVCRPLSVDVLSDIKITATEIELLGDLFTEKRGPGVPMNAVEHSNIHSLHNN